MLFEDCSDDNYEVDEHGFLLNPKCCDEKWIRQHENYIGGISVEHLKVFGAIRTFYYRNGHAPMLRILADEVGFSIGRIINMFTYVKKGDAIDKYVFICKIAGIPYKALTGVILDK